LPILNYDNEQEDEKKIQKGNVNTQMFLIIKEIKEKKKRHQIFAAFK